MPDDPALEELLNLIRLEWAGLSDPLHSEDERAACRAAIKRYYELLRGVLNIDGL